MTTRRFNAVLHVGAPKCGSSALQSALSLNPHLRGADGTRYCYTALGQGMKGWQVLRGRAVTRSAKTNPFGYGSWINPVSAGAEIPFWQMFEGETSHDSGPVPILSNESWMAQPQSFAPHILDPILVTGFVRSPLEWLNAAYWQWAVWDGLPFDQWVSRGPHYTPGRWFSAWAAIPNVTVRGGSAGSDVMESFGRKIGVDGLGGTISNASSPAALIGFLMRNRRFRPSVHAAAVEFVVQRWCRFGDLAKPWAVQEARITEIMKPFEADAALLRKTLCEEDAEEILSRPGWTEPSAAQRSVVPLDDPADLPRLHDAIIEGLQACCRTLRRRPTGSANAATGTEDVALWDAAIADALEALIEADLEWRRRQVPLAFRLASRVHPQGRRLMPRAIRVT